MQQDSSALALKFVLFIFIVYVISSMMCTSKPGIPSETLRFCYFHLGKEILRLLVLAATKVSQHRVIATPSTDVLFHLLLSRDWVQRSILKG